MQVGLDERIHFVTYAISRVPGEESVASLFQADTLAPHQYQQTLRRKVSLEPEQELMFAVLEDAICCFERYASARDKRGMRLFREAEEWIMEEDSDWPYSFGNICEVLGLAPQFVRAGLLRRKEMKLAKVSKGKVYQFTAGRPRKKRAIQRQSAREFYAERWATPKES